MRTSAESSKSLLHLGGKAIADYNMVRPSDCILTGLSGGKNSLSLLHLLLCLQRRTPVRFEVVAVVVDPQSEVYDPSRLIPYMAELGVAYFLSARRFFASPPSTWTTILTAPSARA